MYSIRHLLVIGFAAFTAAFEESPAIIWVPSLAIDAGSVISAKVMPMISAHYNVDIGIVAATRLRFRIRRWVALAKLSFVPSRFLDEEEAEEVVETVVRPVEPRGETTKWRE
ncbi:hypothetical protein B0J13DRAFT_534474 [Dactylonectria estremocensis]|uniref:Uncharacterized protein n=1 Tax=Dactylonectria estremocensis TaxID=1079267 RepID=A0A9P9I7J0_9HYPO|nr:hypothetical protein B0J13DRAFT_534474 [Dactylonectria estremocensis]